MNPKLDHVVVLVHDLHAATRDFEALGFTVLERPDQVHGSTAFRFMSFDDGSYILLTAFRNEAAREKHRLGPVMADGEGLADYSLAVEDLAVIGARLAASGAPVAGPVEVANTLAGGEKWALDLLMLGRGANGDPALPFLVQDRTGRGHRIPGPSVHANGVTGMAGLRVESGSSGLVVDTLLTLFGAGAARTQSEHAGRPADRIDFGSGFVEVVPLRKGDPALGRASCGLLEVVLSTSGSDAGVEGKMLDPTLAHGARIRLVRQGPDETHRAAIHAGQGGGAEGGRQDRQAVRA